jgi:uncharacterized protein (TIGR00369 family)
VVIYGLASALISASFDASRPVNSPEIPHGFAPHFRKSPFTDPWEPLYSKRTENAVILGLRLARPHTNSRGLIHGGLIAALADNAMGYSCAQAIGWDFSLVTISLSVDFTGSADIGQWLAVESEVIRTGGTLCFAQCLVKADDAVIARASGTFRVVKVKSEKITQNANR